MPPLNLPSQQLPSRSPSTRPSHTRSRSSPSVFLSLVVAFGATSFSSSPSSPGSSPGAHLHSPCKARSRLLKRHSTSLEKMQEDEELQSMARQPSSLSLKSKPSSEHSHLHSSTQPPSRQPSFSKRHASFSSPREVPLPSPSSSVSSHLTGYPFPVTAPQSARVAPPGSKGLAADRSQTSPHTPSHRESHIVDSLPSDTSSVSFDADTDYLNTSSATSDHSDHMKHPDGPSNQQPDTREASPATDQRQHISQFHETVAPQSTPILPFARPYSLPDSHTKAYGTSIAQAGPSQPGNWIDRTSTASLPLPSQTPYNLLPRVAGSSSSDAPMFRNHSLQSLFNEASERRHLPAPPSINTVHDDASKPSTSQHLTPSEPAWTPQATPSSPPPPYSRFLSPEEPIPSTRSLSRTSSSTPSIPAPEAPVILTPPPQNEGSSDAQRRAPYNSFLCHAPPPDTWIAVETFESEYRLLVRLPGFRRDGITIATRRRRILHVVADSWEPGGGHFERRVSFGYDADLAQVRAEFDGQMLRIIVPRRPIAVSWHNAQ